MAKGTFLNVLPYVFEEEGGYVNHPADPGGHTNMGITQATLSTWMGTKASAADIRNLSQKTAADIYKKNYWDKIAGDALPAGLDYAVFDFAINSGPARAAKALQKIAGTAQDGIIGDQTLSAIHLRDTANVINSLCDMRQAWLQTLTVYKTFGKGWAARVKRVRNRSLSLVKSSASSGEFSGQTKKPKQTQTRETKLSIPAILKKPETLAPLSGVITGITAMASGNGPVQIAVAIIMVIMAVAGLWYFIRRYRKQL
ncbi:glycoside hydrolase family 108 protein [Pseudochrobactrum sp. sp1633]|uniref:glycoside hydrolase family 108 protein n=1 Tax=Pseudochrobactrum sp. sp1633 TaxID=3036706 RepID=UPI0025A5636B|nr:glycoside hydrolase family 108 protein [Pseudochrobactrum sp. sp1633]MDM8344836.1 glycoside hydrolase family 108 protein [Pseudochrobactrum sp. sp1633]HWD14670.1 glycoside hydrolase family 108 protein [Pseudochrobactrum sp.]